MRQKKLDALYIQHNPVDCLIVYFCVCFTFMRIAHDFFNTIGPIGSLYLIAVVFTVCMGFVMRLWASRTFKELGLEDAL